MIGNLLISIFGKLTNEGFKKFRQIQQIGDKADRLTRELQRLQAIVKDADQKKIKTESEKLWVKELINVAWNIEDVLDNALLLEVAPQGETSKTEGSLNIFKKPRKLSALDNLSYQIDRILGRIDEIFESRERYGIHNLGEGSGEETMLPLKPHVIPDIDDPNVVGFDPHKESIVKMLLDQNTKRRSVLSIVGIGGLGKTTLARKVYNSIDVKANFDLRIWVVVSEKFEFIDVVRRILEQVSPNIDLRGKEKEIQYLLTQLHKSLGDKKYLLVLDDVWTAEFWNHIKGALIDANNGSRVLITSRVENVTKAANLSIDPYKLPLLSDEQGLQLLLQKAHYIPELTNSAYSCDDFLDIARKLVKKCGRLPLALEVLGGLLSRNPPEHIVWSNFLQTVSWSIDGSRCANILATSYDELPLALKFCFMYFAAFPEDYEINATQLIQMWIAEGFIPQEKNRTLEETAHKFLNDLAQRSMIQVSKRSYDHSIEYCRVHDLLRDLAVEKAEEVNFLTVCSKADEEESCREARRVVTHYSDCNGVLKYAGSNLRTLLFFNSQLPNCSGHKLLRVLSDMSPPAKHPTETGPEYFEGLTQLRYLNLGSNNRINSNTATSFANLINNMKFLQTLDFRGIIYNMLSDFLWDVETLRHVLLSFDDGPPPGANLKNLQTLTGVVNRESWETTTVPNLPNLHVLDITITGGFSCKIVTVFLHKLKSLVNLRLSWNNIPLDVLNMRDFPFYQKLTFLELFGQLCHDTGVTIDAAMFPVNLTVLHLTHCRICQDPMAVLEKLHKLKALYIYRGINSCIKKIRCSARGFPRLQNLCVDHFESVEEWDIEEGAMPILQLLDVECFPTLQVPVGLKYLTSLRELYWKFDKYEESVNTKAEEIRNLCTQVPDLRLCDHNRERI